MNRKTMVLVLCALAATVVASLTWQPAISQAPAPAPVQAEQNATCDDAPADTEGSDPYGVKPGCCTTNCRTDRDCDKICGKGVCACITSSDCCRQCTY